MQITTEINKSAYNEVNKYIMPSKLKNNNMMHIAISIITIVLSLLFKLYILTIIGIMTLSINIYIHYKMLQKQFERNNKIFDKIYNNETYKITLKFKDDKLIYLNHQYKKEVSIDYKDIKSIKKTKNYYILFTKNDTYIIIDKNNVDYKKLKEYLKK